MPLLNSLELWVILRPSVGLSTINKGARADFLKVAIFAMAIAPRARFLQNLFLGATAILFAIAASTLTVFTVVKARENTTTRLPASSGSPVAGGTPTQQAVPYNASASTVAGVWLFFWVICQTIFGEEYI
jgi:hypothetical protein